MIMNQVAPPGYMVVPPEPKWPRRSSSKLSQNKVVVHFSDSDFESDSTEPRITTLPVRPHLQRRSTSESQLSTILRSTSQRLKIVKRNSLTRTLSTFRQLPGWPPSHRLPDLPCIEPKEKRRSLNRLNCAESVGSSVNESCLEPSPCLDKKSSKILGHIDLRRERSPTPSAGSDDSLCATQTPDLVIPAQLTSPNKRSLRHEQRHRMSISKGSRDLTAIIRKNSRASIVILGDRKADEEQTVFSTPHRISLASDPFYSSVKSSKPVFPKTKVPDTRPLYVRKSTFGQEATAERPLSYTSPLQNISGNAQSPLKRTDSMDTVMNNSPERNPFQWSPQEALQTRAPSASPKQHGSRRKGHKRSNVIRISNLPRPRSALSTEVVPEEPEDEASQRRYSLPLRGVSEPPKSPRPLPSIWSSRNFSMRPPTSATFSPTLTVPELARQLRDSSPTFGEVDTPSIYSPTLSVCNYYREASDSENEFFNSKRASAAERKLRRHGGNYSIEFPVEVESLVSFSPPPLIIAKPWESPPKSPPSRPLPSITASSAGLMHPKSPSPAPPLLTMPIPGHLTGPRPEPSKRSLDFSSSPRDVATSIGILRRMNSEVSQYSVAPSVTDDGSPTLPAHQSRLSFDEHVDQERGRTRASKNYLSMGQSPPKPRERRVAVKRDSHRIYKERRQRRMNEESLKSDDLTPVREISSPATGSNAASIQNLRFPTISSEGNTGATPPKHLQKSSPITDARWSDAMRTPALSSVRRESAMEHPSPQTPPKWGRGNRDLGVGLIGSKATLIDGQENNENGRQLGRPESLGLYDQDGFLKSSPAKDRLEASAERLGSYVM